MYTTFLVYDQSAYVSTFIYTIYWILIGNTDASIWPVAYELSVPFDTKTISGWYMLLFFSNSMDLAYLTCSIFGTTLFIGLCIYIVAICEHFDLLMQTIQTNIHRNLHEKDPRKFNETKSKVRAQIREAIQTHIMIYE